MYHFNNSCASHKTQYNKYIRSKAPLITVASIIFFVIGWVTLLTVIGPTELVSLIGVENGYLLAFAIAAAGGFSSLTGVSLIATVATLAMGGLNPLLLGICTGAGMTIGDLLYFYLGHASKNALPPESRWHRLVERSSAWLSRKPQWMLPVVTFVYAGFLPLPNDVLTVTLAIAGGKFRIIAVPLLLGNIVHATLWAYLTFLGMQLW